jgi:putative membrane protein
MGHAMLGCTYNGAGIGHWFFGGGIMGFLIMALIIILLIPLILKLIKSNQSEYPKNFDRKDSLRILEIRFAKGDIDEQEFQKKKGYVYGRSSY